MPVSTPFHSGLQWFEHFQLLNILVTQNGSSVWDAGHRSLSQSGVFEKSFAFFGFIGKNVPLSLSAASLQAIKKNYRIGHPSSFLSRPSRYAIFLWLHKEFKEHAISIVGLISVFRKCAFFAAKSLLWPIWAGGLL